MGACDEAPRTGRTPKNQLRPDASCPGTLTFIPQRPVTKFICSATQRV